jgi:hypothetical protein
MILSLQGMLGNVLSWLVTGVLALMLALAAPSDDRVMGEVPGGVARTLGSEAMLVPEGLPAERTLALINFGGHQRGEIEGWVEGLNLGRDPSIAWLRMPVLNDPGNPQAREELQGKLLRHYPQAGERARLAPVFTDRSSFMRTAGLDGPDQVYAVVLSRRGEVLARAQGRFDPNKAEALRETLREKASVGQP